MKKLALIMAVILLLCMVAACSEDIPTETTTTSTTIQNTTTQENSTTTTQVTTTVTGENTTTSTTNSQGGLSTMTSPDLHEPLEPSFFDDAVIIGDSVTLKLSLYVSKCKNNGQYPLGQAAFLCSGSLGYTNALWKLDDPQNVHPRYNGTKYRVPQGVAATGADKVFIMFGMNDFMLYGIDQTIVNAKTLINEILANSPDAKIYVQSVTPILASCEGGAKTNANVRALNTKLRGMCEQNGWTYLDVASVMVNANGSLKTEYCGDPDSMGIHFTDAACKAWIEYLKKNV
ncbi:MAG: hypothetical protein IKU25_05775 [Clostridia bacterium]|nr:hypothetical protein [Clostridia bacterium]